MNTTAITAKSKLFSDRSFSLTVLLLLFAAGLFMLMSPLLALLSRSLFDNSNNFIGLDNFVEYAQSPELLNSFMTTMMIGFSVAAITVTLAFIVAYVIQRSCLPGKGLMKVVGLLPILAPSMLPAIGLIYLFGNQGILKPLIGDASIYGTTGIIIGLVVCCFPHALLLTQTGLRQIDGRLYEAARAMRTSAFKTFMTVTLPSAKFGIISAFITVFTLSICDFGVAIIIGGKTSVLATDIYKLAIGMHNFGMSAVAAIALLVPALITFSVDAWLKRKVTNMGNSQATNAPTQSLPLVHSFMGVVTWFVLAIILAIIAMPVYGSFVSFWPFNTTLTLNHYNLDAVSSYGFSPFFNSIQLAFCTAFFGTIVVFIGAYVSERSAGFKFLKALIGQLVMLPLAVPGLVLGIGYVMFFSSPSNPFNGLYGAMALLVICTIVHLYSVAHLMCVTSFKNMPVELEGAAASLKISRPMLILRVILPISLPVLIDIFVYLFVSAMITTSAVIFLYNSGNIPASIAVLHLDESGNMASAAAMSVFILLTACTVKLLGMWLARVLQRRQLQA
ncbi:iron(III) transport system permease protein [Sinobacterium caligoides]|uniref:Iron(III) transport system permease protein n=1 Tax=Sinobacterium caligoides TaxID=933926 RepID=A0A3N2DZX9_9GAMM|nr:putative 2-aminoethylphosphonate ABC transporter permease subunit [Sinobacterium caligoides]ROS05423.1 iron(III) transport system permease protein [Sinobacterium caligoides]